MYFNQKAFDNIVIQGIPFLERTDTSDQDNRFAPMKRTELDGEISGPIAELSLTQVFLYHYNEITGPIEAIYRFPLPGDAAVTGVTVQFGDITIETILLPRKQAEDEYQEARETNRQATLLTRESPDVFTLMVNGIKPGEEVQITTRFILAGCPEKTGFAFRIPLTTAPRYVRGDERNTRHAQGNPLATLLDPLHRFSARLTMTGDGELHSPVYSLKCSDRIYSLADGEIIPNQDFVVECRPAVHEQTISAQVFTSGEDEPCMLALITPPFIRQPRIPLDVIVLVDHSGSMDGSKRNAADTAVKQFLSHLTPQDCFNLCCFDHTQYWYEGQPVQATVHHIIPALDLLYGTHSGGTELGVTIEQALSQDRTRGSVSRHLVIITDAEVTDSGRILQIIENEATHSDYRRCSVLCIDSSPNALLARQIAEKTGGIATFLTSSPEEGDITRAITDILSSWEYLIAEGVTCTVNRSTVITRERHTTIHGLTKIEIPPVGGERSSWILMKAGEGEKSLSCSLELPDGTACSPSFHISPGVKRLFGAWLVQKLESLMHSEPTDDEIYETIQTLGMERLIQVPELQSCIYAENRMKGLRKYLSSVIEHTSLQYGIISCETAFFAARTEAGEKTLMEVIVPSAYPDGWADPWGSSGFQGNRCQFLPNKRIPASCDNIARIKPRQTLHLMEYASGPDISWMGSGSSYNLHGIRSFSEEIVIASSRAHVRSDQPANTKPVIKKESKRKEMSEYSLVVFDGVPSLLAGVCILYDSDSSDLKDAFPIRYKILKITVIASQSGDTCSENPGSIEIFCSDSKDPDFIIRLDARTQFGWSAPLDIIRESGEELIITLRDPEGFWNGKNITVKLTIASMIGEDLSKVDFNRIVECP